MFKQTAFGTVRIYTVLHRSLCPLAASLLLPEEKAAVAEAIRAELEISFKKPSICWEGPISYPFRILLTACR